MLNRTIIFYIILILTAFSCNQEPPCPRDDSEGAWLQNSTFSTTFAGEGEQHWKFDGNGLLQVFPPVVTDSTYIHLWQYYFTNCHTIRIVLFGHRVHGTGQLFLSDNDFKKTVVDFRIEGIWKDSGIITGVFDPAQEGFDSTRIKLKKIK